MSKSTSGHFSGTNGAKIAASATLPKSGTSTPLFSNTGHVSHNSISANREFFYGKSVTQIDNALKSQGYTTTIRKSKHDSSKAKIIVSTNSNKHRNIHMLRSVQIMPENLKL